ncbi:Uncharacterised protein [Vibrio cholerae]|nr:Uncharacterised protein [Vibrio cholerae]CSB56592.1 Uncharacterised protein [Vibrio cholerae]CSB63145.1 Uncharacterised protein [Vibrio cholerae]CSB90618.1 Uncharacterised protein [Vibrio cholerae]CSB99865.1 Uncharacterised protein [Vibrio cholerae]
MPPRQQHFHKRLLARSDNLYAHAFGFNTHEKRNGKEIDKCRNKRHRNNIHIRNLRVRRHDERACAHHWRHELPTGRSCGFHPCGETCGKARFFHHGNGNNACRDRVRDTRSRHRPHQTRSQYSNKTGAPHHFTCRSA